MSYPLKPAALRAKYQVGYQIAAAGSFSLRDIVRLFSSFVKRSVFVSVRDYLHNYLKLTELERVVLFQYSGTLWNSGWSLSTAAASRVLDTPPFV